MYLQKIFKFPRINYWLVSSLFISLVVCIPLVVISSSFFVELSGYYNLLQDTYLYLYLFNTLALLIGVIILTLIFGVGSAYLVSFYKFPGSSFFTWALILSFAIPGYIYAYSLTAFFEYFGSLYSILKYIFGEGDYNNFIPRIDSLIGSILSISLSLYIYVYLITRACFIYQSQSQIDAGKNMGFSNYQIFKRILLPSARPGIVAGLSLVAMECISDFGTVSFFNVQSLTTAIYDSWIVFDDINTAYQLSFFLIFFILIFFIIEKISRSRSRFNIPSRGYRSLEKINLQGRKKWFAFYALLILFFVSFIFPISQMIFWIIKFPSNFDLSNILALTMNTMLLVVSTTLILILLSFITNYGMRISESKTLNIITNFSISGYAIPGIILALTLLSFISFVSSYFNNESIKVLFIGTVFGLVLAYCVRFYSLAINGIKTGYDKLNKSLDDVSYLMGNSKLGTFLQVHFPFLKQNLILISMLVSIDILKELPLTLILRPYNFETFATKAYVFASQDMLEYTAGPSLFLIFFASLIILISRKNILKGF